MLRVISPDLRQGFFAGRRQERGGPRALVMWPRRCYTVADGFCGPRRAGEEGGGGRKRAAAVFPRLGGHALEASRDLCPGDHEQLLSVLLPGGPVPVQLFLSLVGNVHRRYQQSDQGPGTGVFVSGEHGGLPLGERQDLCRDPFVPRLFAPDDARRLHLAYADHAVLRDRSRTAMRPEAISTFSVRR